MARRSPRSKHSRSRQSESPKRQRTQPQATGSRKHFGKPKKTDEALADTPRDKALEAIKKLETGYWDKSGAGYGRAQTNEAGCLLTQKKSNREGGYVQISPPVPEASTGKAGYKVTPADSPRKRFEVQDLQLIQRLVVRAFKCKLDIDKLLRGEQASHRCAQRKCINPQHILVEPQALNEARRRCKGLAPRIRTKWRGETIELTPNDGCECAKTRRRKCIPMVEWREARAVRV